MDNAILAGLSMQVGLQRQLDVIANNIANLNTAGFKADSVVFEEYLASGARADEFPLAVDQRVSLVLDRETRIDLAQGALHATGNPFDVAIDGEGFLVVETPEGERYTRGGTLALNADGELVTAAGHRVLSDAGPIVLDPNDTELSIARDGTVSTREGERGRLRIVRFENAAELVKEGLNLFSSSGEPQPADSRTRVVQGSIEKSNVNSVLEIGRMIEVTRLYTTLANLMSSTEELRQAVLERLAEYSA